MALTIEECKKALSMFPAHTVRPFSRGAEVQLPRPAQPIQAGVYTDGSVFLRGVKPLRTAFKYWETCAFVVALHVCNDPIFKSPQDALAPVVAALEPAVLSSTTFQIPGCLTWFYAGTDTREDLEDCGTLLDSAIDRGQVRRISLESESTEPITSATEKAAPIPPEIPIAWRQPARFDMFRGWKVFRDGQVNVEAQIAEGEKALFLECAEGFKYHITTCTRAYAKETWEILDEVTLNRYYGYQCGLPEAVRRSWVFPFWALDDMLPMSTEYERVMLALNSTQLRWNLQHGEMSKYVQDTYRVWVHTGKTPREHVQELKERLNAPSDWD